MKKQIATISLLFGWLLSIFPYNAFAQQPLSLQECYQLALDYSDRVAISKEEIQVARARFTQALGQVLPQIIYKFTEFLQDPQGVGGADPVGSTFTQLSRTTGSFNFKQILFRGFQEIQGIKIARLDQRRTKEQLQDVQRLLFLDVVVAFYTISLVERDIETEKLIISVVQDRVKELKRRVELGKSREGELTQEEALLALLKAGLVRTQGERTIAYEMMSFLTGKDPMPPIRWQEPVDATEHPLNYYLGKVPQRPDLQAAQTQMEIAKRNIKVARGNFMPTVDLESNVYTFRPGFQSEILWDTSINAEVPLFKYQNFGVYKEAKVVAKQVEFEAQNLLRIARNEVKKAFDNLDSAKKQYRLYKQAANLAYQNFQYQNRDFNLGRATNLDVLTAQRTWLESLDERNRSEVQTWLDWTQLQISAGVLP